MYSATRRYFCISCYPLEVVFFSIKANNQKHVTEVLEIFGNHFSHVFELKINKSKCEVASVGILKGVRMVLCVMKCINLKTDTVKVYGIYFSYNKNSRMVRITENT